MAQPKRKQSADTETLRAEAQAALQAIDTEIAELDAQRLDLDPQAAVTKEIALAAARRDAQRRIELLDQRAADELRARQVKSQAALIERVEKRFEERNEAIAEMCSHLAGAVTAMEKVHSLNDGLMACWPWDLVIDSETLIFGKFFQTAIRSELWRLSGRPFISGSDRGGFSFPGSQNPTPFGDLRPSSVRALSEKTKDASSYATRIMRQAPIRSLPPAPPPAPAPAPVEIKPNGGAPAAVATPQPEQQPRKTATAEYVFHAQFTNRQTGEQRTEEVMLGPAELEEASLDGLGGTGPRAKEIALRIATERVGSEFKFDSVKFDMNRLLESLNN